MKLIKLTLLTIFMVFHAAFTVYGYVKGIQAIRLSGEISNVLLMLISSGILIACLLYLIANFDI